MKKIISIILLSCLILSALCSCGMALDIESVFDTGNYKAYYSFYTYYVEKDYSKNYGYGYSESAIPSGYVYLTGKYEEGDSIQLKNTYYKVEKIVKSYQVQGLKIGANYNVTYYEVEGLRYDELSLSLTEYKIDLPKVTRKEVQLNKNNIAVKYYD